MKGFLIALACACGFAAAPADGEAPTATRAAAISRCESWIRARAVFPTPAAPEAFIASDSVACFDGEISKESVTPIDAWLTRVPSDSHPLLLVRSRGGDAEAGIGIMEDLQSANAEVRVVDLCASSCANYLFAGAKHRSVTDGAVILFHGGYSPSAREDLLKGLEKVRESGKAPANTNWDRVRALALADFDRVAALQDQMYARIGVSNDVVRGMDKFDIDSLDESQCDSTRPAERKAVFFTPAQLERMGIRMESGREAADPREVNRSLREMGSSSEACLAPDSYFGSSSPG